MGRVGGHCTALCRYENIIQIMICGYTTQFVWPPTHCIPILHLFRSNANFIYLTVVKRLPAGRVSFLAASIAILTRKMVVHCVLPFTFAQRMITTRIVIYICT